MSRAAYRANRDASQRANEDRRDALLWSVIPPWHESQYEPGEAHPSKPQPRKVKPISPFAAMLFSTALAMTGDMLPARRR